MFRKTAAIIVLIGLLAGTGYAAYRWNSPDDVPLPFETDQFIEVQIVSAPLRHVADDREYTQDELRNVGYTDYPDDEVEVLSTRILRVDASGRAQEFQGRSDDIEMLGGWAKSRKRDDKRPGLTLERFRFGFPSTFWQKQGMTGHMMMSFSPGRTTFGRELAIVSMIVYQGDSDATTDDDLPDTFLRARWLPEPPERTVVEVDRGVVRTGGRPVVEINSSAVGR